MSVGATSEACVSPSSLSRELIVRFHARQSLCRAFLRVVSLTSRRLLLLTIRGPLDLRLRLEAGALANVAGFDDRY